MFKQKLQRLHKTSFLSGSHFSTPTLTLFALIFASIGTYFLFFSHASSSLPSDINNDGVVNVSDLSLLLSSYGSSSSACVTAPQYTCDLNGDGSVNIVDLSILLSNFGQTASAFPTSPVLDNFNRTAENPLSDAGNWATSSVGFGDNGFLQTNGTQALSSVADGSWSNSAWATPASLPVEVYASAPVLPTGSHSVNLAWLSSPTSATPTGYYISFRPGITTIQVNRVDPGGAAIIATFGLTGNSAGDQYGMSVSAAGLITAWRNGTAMGSVTDTTYSGSGYIGLETNDATLRLDDFGGSGTASTGGPTDPTTQRWYALSSPWNTPIPAGTAYRPNDAALSTSFQSHCDGCLNPAFGGVPSVYFANASTPTVPVTLDYPTCGASIVNVPIPSGTLVAPRTDTEARLTIMMTDSSVEWDMWKITKPGDTPIYSCSGADGHWHAVVAHKSLTGWQGSGDEASSRASQTLDGAGLLRPLDSQMPAGSTWQHTLAMSYPGELNSFVTPASSDDGVCTDVNSCIPAGARMQLDPTLNCTTTVLLSVEWQRQECRTLQAYGAIVVDKPCDWPCTGGSVNAEQPQLVGSTSFQDGGLGVSFPWYPTNTIPSTLYPFIHFIDWTKWTN